MKKIFSIYFMVICFSSVIFSQEILIQGGLGFGVGDFHFALNNKLEAPGYGGSITYTQKASQSLDLYALVGIYFFSEEFTGEKARIIPLMAGLKFNFGAGGFLPYLGFEAGYNFINYDTPFLNGSMNWSVEEFGIAPILGIQVPITRSIFWDISGKYNIIFSSFETNSYIGIYTGLGFGF